MFGRSWKCTFLAACCFSLCSFLAFAFSSLSCSFFFFAASRFFFSSSVSAVSPFALLFLFFDSPFFPLAFFRLFLLLLRWFLFDWLALRLVFRLFAFFFRFVGAVLASEVDSEQQHPSEPRVHSMQGLAFDRLDAWPTGT